MYVMEMHAVPDLEQMRCRMFGKPVAMKPLTANMSAAAEPSLNDAALVQSPSSPVATRRPDVCRGYCSRG